MKYVITLVLAGAGYVSLLNVPAMAADKPATISSQTSNAVLRNAWPAETMNGKVMMIDPGERLLVVKGPDGVPFDMDVTPMTRIQAGDQRLNLQDLSQYQNRNVSVRFIPERKGDVARSIQING